MIQRIIEALNKGNKYLWEVLNSTPPRLVYVSGSHGYRNKNLGDEALFGAYKELFNRCSFVHYPGGRVLSIPSKLTRISGCAMLAC